MILKDPEKESDQKKEKNSDNEKEEGENQPVGDKGGENDQPAFPELSDDDSDVGVGGDDDK